MIYAFNPLTLLLVFILYANTPETSKLYKPVLYVGAVIDFIVNVTWFTVIFWDIPKEYLLTKRVERLKQSDGYRGRLAILLCGLMNKINNNHCRG